MGEVALRRIQAGVETTKGTAVPATKKLYGTFALTRAQARKFAQEDRGAFADKWRANPKLIEAGGTLQGDALFEDMPYYLDHFLKGGVVQSGTALLGYTWTYAPDTSSDTLTTRTLEVGDEQVSWQGAYGNIDTADFTMALDDTVKMSVGYFVKDWTGPFTYTAGLTDRAVEGCTGWQGKLYIDPAGATPGTTQVTGKWKSASWSYHNQNKRKFFGDGSATFTKMGRGRRQIHCQVQIEGSDLTEYNNFTAGPVLTERIIRLAFSGSVIPGTSPSVNKQMLFDFWGDWDTWTYGNVDTNTAFTLDLQAVVDIGAGKEAAVTIVNGNTAL